MTSPVFRVAGQAQHLGKRLGRGGEGDVYALENQPGKALKVYKDSLRHSREGKVRAMVGGGLGATGDLVVAFPVEIATDAQGQFAGFIMRLVSGHRPIHELYGPKSRKREFSKADFRFLIRAAQNVARAVALVHKAGCVIGDFNHSGILVAEDATVALIDADSFQFTLNGTLYPCVVGVPEFTPPELQGKDLRSVARTTEHDSFGLAVAIFHLLAMGKHPYAGRHLGEDMSLGEAIAQNRFAFSVARRAQTQTTPPPGSIVLEDFPFEIANAFEAAFGVSANRRPTPADWVTLLGGLEANLHRCSKVATHFYPSAARECVWCRMTGLSGVEMFPSTFDSHASATSSGLADFERLAVEIRAIRLPPIDEILPKWSGKLKGKSPTVVNALWAHIKERIFGALVLVMAVVGAASAPGAAIIWIGVAIFGLIRVFSARIDPDPFLKAYSHADQRARTAQKAFLKRSGAFEFYALRDKLERCLIDYKGLPDEEARALTRLRSTREQRQRSLFLDGFLIRRARIPGIGPAKMAILASFGIESADDITFDAVMAVPGFGPALTGNLLAWRRAQEVKFRFNGQPNSSDVQAEAAVHSAISAKRTALLRELSAGAMTLRNASVRLRSLVPDQPVLSALEALARAERDCRDLGLDCPARAPITIADLTSSP